VRVLLDGSLLRFDDVWTAAGTPHSVMRIRLDDIRDAVGGDFDVAR
jgi:prolyl-tRNA editing enzyme YbaK/EbsC (Cys-tRNA(Pro) deacylase)